METGNLVLHMGIHKLSLLIYDASGQYYYQKHKKIPRNNHHTKQTLNMFLDMG